MLLMASGRLCAFGSTFTSVAFPCWVPINRHFELVVISRCWQKGESFRLLIWESPWADLVSGRWSGTQ